MPAANPPLAEHHPAGMNPLAPENLFHQRGSEHLHQPGEKYRVQPNESYWVISQKTYGTGAYFKALAEHNRDRYPRPDQIQVGDLVSVPSAATLAQAYPDLCPRPRQRAANDGVMRNVSSRDHLAAGGRVYTVRQGDTLFDIATWVAAHRVEGDGPYRAGRDLLLKTAPRLRPGAPWKVDGESDTDRARRLVLELDETVLPVQGPPGSGKTYIGAQMVCALVRAGKKVGITATSHKVIRNLLDAIVRQAGRENLDPAHVARYDGKMDAEAAAEAGDTASKCNRVELRVMPPVVDDDDALARRTRDPDASSCARRSRPRSFAMPECRAGARNTELPVPARRQEAPILCCVWPNSS